MNRRGCLFEQMLHRILFFHQFPIGRLHFRFAGFAYLEIGNDFIGAVPA